MPAAAFTELVSEWHKVNGARPQGAPVGMTVASDGAIWLVEDKNATVIRIDVSPGAQTERLPCGARSDEQIDQLVAYVHTDQRNRQRLRQMRTQLVEKHCVGCHSDFGLRPEQGEQDKDDAVLRFALSQDSWIYPGDPDAGRLRTRLNGLGSEKVMPANGRQLLRKILRTASFSPRSICWWGRWCLANACAFGQGASIGNSTTEQARPVAPCPRRWLWWW